MSRRNSIILIIVVIILGVLGYMYFNPAATPGTTSGGGIGNFLSRFNPWKSSSIPTPAPAPTPTPTDDGQPGETPVVGLVRVSSMPIAGYTIFQKERLKSGVIAPLVVPPPTPTTTTPKTKVVKPAPIPTEFASAARYVDRATGNIYQTFADKIEERKFSTTIIPKVYEAIFGNKGTAVVMRYLKSDDRTIETFVGNLPKEVLGVDTGGANEIKGIFLPDNVTDMSIAADGSKLFYIFNSGTSPQMATGISMDFVTGKKVQIFQNAFTEWLTTWPNSRLITLTTKPTSSVPGYVYDLDMSGKLGEAFGGVVGLTTLTSPSGKLILYANNNLDLSIYDSTTKNSSSLGVRTLPDKCVWGALSDVIYCAVPRGLGGGQYPDAWYQGEVSFDDQIWRVDPVSGVGNIISDPATVSGVGSIDGTKLSLDDAHHYLFFVNKKDSSLWQLNLQ